MIPRFLIAFVGAVAVTIGLFLFMNDVSDRMRLRDGTMYFKITDFIPAPDPGRQLPEAPTLPELRPNVPGLEYVGSGGAALEVEPSVELDPLEVDPDRADLAD